MSPKNKNSMREAFDAETFRRDGHALIDQLADHLATMIARRSPAVMPWLPPAQQVAETPALTEEPAEDIATLAANMMQRSLRLHDPRCMGHQDSVPLPVTALASLVASLINNDPSIYEIAPNVVAMERRVLEWFLAELHFPDGADGIITSGGSLGNLTALLAARQSRAGYDAWEKGASGGPPLCVLASQEIHYCVARAVRMMGWGSDGCIAVPVDKDLRMCADALPESLERARAAGLRPIAVVASAGTTATGAFDPLAEIADFCRRNELWMHVDGAHGAVAQLSPKYRHLVNGIEHADSVVWDGHKMMMLPTVFTAVLFRDGRTSYESFRQEATYLFEGRPDEEWYNMGNRTIECTKNSMAVRLYAALRVHGAGLMRDYVTNCFDIAGRFADLIEDSLDFELCVRPQGNIICFRHTPDGATDLDALQHALRKRVVRSGHYYLVDAEVHDQTWLRSTLMHPLAAEEDLHGLLDQIRLAAREI